MIRREAARLRRLVDNVLDFSRLDRGKPPRARLQAVVPDTWRRSLAEEAVDWVQQHHGHLMCRGAWPEAPAMLDPEALRRAVLNLLDNALRHSGSDRCELRFDHDPLESQLILEVRDFGKGIPAGKAQSLFEPFQQLEPSKTADPGTGSPGAGLGLAIVAEIVRAHQGSLQVANAPAPGGALFRILLPIHPPPSDV